MSQLLEIPALPVPVRHRSLAPVHVIGHGRSGTSVFIRLLRKYLRIAFGTESQFVIRYYLQLQRYGDLQFDANLRRLVESIHRERWFERCRQRFGFETSADAILENVTERTYRGVLNAVFGRLQHFLEMPRWGDKTPEYLYHLPKLKALFPEAKYIHVVRDGRDVALSGFEQPFGEQNIFQAAHDWVHAMAAANAFGQALPGHQFLEVRYEEFVSEPMRQFERLIEFLEIEDPHGILLEYISAHVTEDLMQGNFGKWKTRLNQRQIHRFDCIACQWLRAYGYDCSVAQAIPAGLLPTLFWRFDNKVRKWLRPDYWSDNLYKASLRMRAARG